MSRELVGGALGVVALKRRPLVAQPCELNFVSGLR